MIANSELIKPTIRQAEIEDVPVLLQAQRKIAETAGFFASNPSELTPQSVERMIFSKTGIFLVAEQDGVIVGHGFLERFQLESINHIAELSLVVHPGWQGQGIGGLLIQKLIEWAKQNAIEKIELIARSTNTRAISLYERMGFKEEGRIKKRIKIDDNNYIDDLFMGLFLNEEAK